MPSFGSIASEYRRKSGANATPTKKKTSSQSAKSPMTRSSTQSAKSPFTGAPVRSYAPATYVTPAVGSGGIAANYGTPSTMNAMAASANPGGFTPASTSGGLYGGTTTGLPSEGSTRYTGYASQFDPGATQETLWRDPQSVLNADFQAQGLSTASPMYSTLRDFYGADPQSLWLLLQGNKPGNFQDAGDYANFLHSLYGNYMKPGGNAIDFNEILGILGGMGDQSNLAAQDQSPLWQLLTSGGPAEQVRSTYGLLGDAAKVGLSPAMASAFMDALARQSDSYLTQSMQSSTPVDPYYQWYQNPMLGR